jgi:FMN phosphatase YigB (HAD superfamily)
MSLKAVLFDLDGTLLPMDMDKFIKTYFGGLAKRMAPFGYVLNIMKEDDKANGK